VRTKVVVVVVVVVVVIVVVLFVVVAAAAVVVVVVVYGSEEEEESLKSYNSPCSRSCSAISPITVPLLLIILSPGRVILQ